MILYDPDLSSHRTRSNVIRIKGVDQTKQPTAVQHAGQVDSKELAQGPQTEAPAQK